MKYKPIASYYSIRNSECPGRQIIVGCYENMATLEKKMKECSTWKKFCSVIVWKVFICQNERGYVEKFQQVFIGPQGFNHPFVNETRDILDDIF